MQAVFTINSNTFISARDLVLCNTKKLFKQLCMSISKFKSSLYWLLTKLSSLKKQLFKAWFFNLYFRKYFIKGKPILPRLLAALIQSFLLFCFLIRVIAYNKFSINITSRVTHNLIRI